MDRIVRNKQHLFTYDDVSFISNTEAWHLAHDMSLITRQANPNQAKALVGRVIQITGQDHGEYTALGLEYKIEVFVLETFLKEQLNIVF